jgi:hypothetical protein
MKRKGKNKRKSMTRSLEEEEMVRQARFTWGLHFYARADMGLVHQARPQKK